MAKKRIPTELDGPESFAFNKAQFNRLCAKSDVIALQMISSSVNVQPSYFEYKDEAKFHFSQVILQSWVDAEEKITSSIFRFEIKVRQGRKDLMALNAEFIVAYTVPDDVDNQNAEAYCKRSGMFAAYPYFKAYVAQVNAFAHVELPNLPVLRAGPVHVAQADPAKEHHE